MIVVTDIGSLNAVVLPKSPPNIRTINILFGNLFTSLTR